MNKITEYLNKWPWILGFFIAIPALLIHCNTQSAKPEAFVLLTHYNNETRSLYTSDPLNWSTSYTHEDYPENLNGDIAIHKGNGITQYIAFLHKKSDEKWYLMIQAGLGAANWSEEFFQKQIPGPAKYNKVVINYLRDALFGLIWTSGDTIYTAVLDPQKPDGQEITLSPPLVHPQISDVLVPYMSMTYHNGQVYLQLAQNTDFSFQGPMQFIICRGNISPCGITFSQVSLSPQHMTSCSNIISYNDSLYIAISQRNNQTGGQFLLLASNNGANWKTAGSCPKTLNQYIDHQLLFTDRNGHFKSLVVDIFNPEGAHGYKLIDFNGCADSPFSFHLGTLGYDYYPGRL